METDKTTLNDLAVFQHDEEFSIFNKLNFTRTVGGREKLKSIFNKSLGDIASIQNVQRTLKVILEKKDDWPLIISNGSIMVIYKFYETIFDIKLNPLDVANIKMRVFPLDDTMTEVGGAVVYNAEFYKPSATEGPLIYLNGNPDVQIILDKIEAAGGKITMPKTKIGDDIGFMAFFLDTEGNLVGLHSQK